MGRLFEHPATIFFLILIVLLLFGAKRLPDVAKGVGQSLKIFKREVRDLTEDDDKPAPPAVPTVPPAAAAPPAPAAPATPPAPVAPAPTEQGSTDPRP